MEASTPLMNHNDLRRRTLLKNTVDVSPLRKSVIQDSTPSLRISLLEISNDENERSNRRNNAEIQKRLSNLPQGRTQLSDSYVKEQFTICTHLYTENKITTKNAWKLQIIDMLNALCNKNNKDTLQVASTSIDISAKVYGIRVDDVHSDGLKLASSMARVTEKVSPQEMDDEDELETDKEKGPTQTKKKKKRVNYSGVKNTVSEDSKNCLDSIPKLEPVDFSTRVNAETGTINNLFTNIMKEDNTGYTYVLLDKSKTMFDKFDPTVQNIEDDGHCTPLNNIPAIDCAIVLNAPFKDFRIDEWDPDQEEKQLNAERSRLSEKQQVIYDENGIPIPELDGSIQDIFENNDIGNIDDDDDDDVQSIHEEIAPQLRGEIARIEEFRPVNSSAPMSEYTHNSIISTHSGRFIDQIWAGPCHWKLKFIRRSTARISGPRISMKETKQGRRKAQPEMIDYTVDVDIDFTKIFRIKKKPPTVDINKITLPIQDQSCVKLMENIKELMLKPGVCPVEKKTNETQLDYEVTAYKYENPNDSLYCSQQNSEDVGGDENDVFGSDDAEEHMFVERQNFLGDNLVTAPEMVPNSYVPYALKAKQMDMKKLKVAIWHNLTNSAVCMLPEAQNRRVIPSSFSKMYSELPDLLPEKEKNELSCPLAFVALLHLCNEKNLHLTQHPGYKDFDIRGPAEE